MFKTLKKLQAYMRGRKILLPGALLFSALSSLVGMLPFVFIWLIVKGMLSPDSSEMESINLYAWLAVATAFGGVVLYFVALSLSHLAAFRVETEMRRVAMKKIIKLPLGFFDNNTTGRIRKIIDDNASVTHGFLAHQLPDLAASILMPIASVVLIFVFDWQLGLACVFPVIIAMSVMGFLMGGNGKHFMKMYMESLEEMNSEAVEYVRGIPVVKVFQQTVYSFKSFHNSIVRYKEMVTKYTKIWEKPMSAYTVIIHGIAYFLVPVAILLIGRTGDLQGVILNLLLFVLISPVFALSVMRSMYLNQASGQAAEAINRVEEIMKYKSLTAATNPQPITHYSIEFDNVSFSYPGAKQKAVNNINFKIPKGKTFALVGASGSGKTTIARLVPRFWDVNEGRVTIGGVDVRDIANSELMANISFVFQNSRLFKTSLLDNIRYGKPNATQEETNKALDAAQCRDIVNALPDGLNTKIGTEGTFLSGGEQQRILLSRAILKDAPIVVLDEATAFADPENEHLIQKALKKLRKGKTVLMIAHRLSSIVDVDCILVIDNGKIVEQGNHNELLGKQGVYKRMWNEYESSIQWTIGDKVPELNLNMQN